MKKLLTIIGVSVFFVIIAAGAAYNNQFVHIQELMPYSNCPNPTSELPVPHAVWNQDECYWFVENSSIPYQLQRVLDVCKEKYHETSPNRSMYSNGTHVLDSKYCFWQSVKDYQSNAPNDHDFNPPDEIILDIDSTPLVQKILDKYKNMSEVVAFYAKYDDAQVSVREDHISYFAGSDDGALMRMNIFFDENQTITEIDTHCYFQKAFQYEIPQEDIVYRLERVDSKKICDW